MAQIIKTKSRLYETMKGSANVGNFILKNETESIDADAAIKGTELTAVATNGKPFFAVFFLEEKLEKNLTMMFYCNLTQRRYAIHS